MTTLPITPELEAELIEAGALHPTGLILRPSLRAAFDRIADSAIPMRVSSWQAMCNAERFLLSIHRYAKRRSLTFDTAAASLGY